MQETTEGAVSAACPVKRFMRLYGLELGEMSSGATAGAENLSHY